MTTKFKKQLHRAVKLLLRELRDGCVECQCKADYCNEHRKKAYDIALHPTKYIKLEERNGRIVSTSLG